MNQSINKFASWFKFASWLLCAALLTACGSDHHDHGAPMSYDTSFSPDMSIVEKWKNIKLIDVHNHGACCVYDPEFRSIVERYYVDRIVLFGNISDPAALESDTSTWAAYQATPSKIIPFFSGFEMYDAKGIDRVITNLNKGYFGIGETVAASYYSPVASKAAWKAQHPMDGNLPRIYELCAQYKVPILLHIDPLDGNPVEPVQKLEVALKTYPDTIFILGHGNAYNPPANINYLLDNYSNVYIDFFAGFTIYNSDSRFGLDPWVALVKQYPDRFMVSTDSGYGVGLSHAYYAIYAFIDAINDETLANKVAHENFLNLIQSR